MTEQEKQKLKDALIEHKNIATSEYDDEDAFVGIYFSDLVDIIDSVMNNTGWHPASELPPENAEIVIWTEVHSPQFENAPVGYVPILGRLIDGKWPSNIIVKYWCYLPDEK